MPLKKKYQSNDTVCKVTFVLPKAIEAGTAHLVGDFNGWSETATPMTQLKSGQWKVDLKLDAGKEYEYRYYVDGSEWYNDWEADRYTPNPFAGENSVVRT